MESVVNSTCFPVVPNLDVLSLGSSLLIGVVLNWGLMGFLCVQIYMYYLAFPRDNKLSKSLVYGVFISEVVQTVILTIDTHNMLVGGFGDQNILNGIHTFWFTVPIAGGISGCIGQLFFAFRISKVTDSMLLPGTISLCALTSLGSAIAAAVQFKMAGTFYNIVNMTSSYPAVGTWNGIGALCDLIIAIAMPYYILRRGTGLSSTHDILTSIMKLTVETGVLTACLAMAHLIIYFTQSYQFIILGSVIAKIYANTILVILNNRIEFNGGRTQVNRDQRESDMSSIGTFRVGPGSSTSRIQVSRDRLTFRLDDMPTMRRSNSAQENSSPAVASNPERKSESDSSWNKHPFPPIGVAV